MDRFVSSTEIEESKRRRAEEWKAAYERIGQKPPAKEEEIYDPRTLYERLQEQKTKKEELFQEMTRFSNLIHRLDEDEIDFLATLENEERDKELEKMKKVEEELEEFRRAAAKANEEAIPKLVIPQPPPPAPVKSAIKRDAQRMILDGAIKKNIARKKSSNEGEGVNADELSRKNKRLKLDQSPTPTAIKGATTISTTSSIINEKSTSVVSSNNSKESSKITTSNNNNTLASLLQYSDDSSDNENNNNTDDP
ncbi:11740_t:CDS:2 [Acaulospora colombiana]|uniref:11740_t:CDS:1 n=1 Tax=Acaulospora colombiana TaxID=27376 RepID=A0ACA9KZG0_9GLOM|nr:11740_t:CDS:2 [Acaulospora colombiana]